MKDRWWHIALLVGLAIGFGTGAWLLRKVRPIISGLEPGRDRISPADGLRAQAKACSTGTLFGLLVLDAVLFLLSGWIFITGPLGQYGVGWLGVLVFGAGTIYTVALIIAKRKQSIS